MEQNEEVCERELLIASLRYLHLYITEKQGIWFYESQEAGMHAYIRYQIYFISKELVSRKKRNVYPSSINRTIYFPLGYIRLFIFKMSSHG